MTPLMVQVLQYRQGTLSDKAALRELSLAAYAPYSTVLVPEDWKSLASFLIQDATWDFLFSNAIAFVCEEQGELIGMAFMLPSGHPNSIFKSEWATLRMVGVRPAAGGKGVGRKLTEMAMDAAWQAGEKTLALHTTEFMQAARHIYESLGFTVYQELGLIYNKKNWVYTLDLSQV